MLAQWRHHVALMLSVLSSGAVAIAAVGCSDMVVA